MPDVETNATELIGEYENKAPRKTFKEIVGELIAMGGKKITTRIKKIELEAKEAPDGRAYYQYNTVITDYIKTDFTNQRTGECVTESNIIYPADFVVAAVIRENSDIAWLADEFDANPRLVGPILTGATITLIQVPFEAGNPVINKFKPGDIGKTYDHRVFQNNLVRIKLGEAGSDKADKLFMSIAAASNKSKNKKEEADVDDDF